MDKQTYVIVGGIAGGATAAARLRRLDEDAEIIIFERGGYISTAACGIPYYIGGVVPNAAAISGSSPEAFAAKYNLKVNINSRVVSIDRTAKTVSVKNNITGEAYRQSYDKLLLAPGARPAAPDIPGIDSEKVFTLKSIEDAFRLHAFIEKHNPKSALVLGGGFIGIEAAENLKLRGIDVTVAELTDQVLPPLDFEMAAIVHNHLEEKGVRLIRESGIQSVTDKGNALHVAVGSETVQADFLLLAAGIRPDGSLAKIAGLEVNKIGSIIVSEEMRTSDPDIYAVGDAVQLSSVPSGMFSSAPLAGPAQKQARIAADNICGIHSRYMGTQGSSVVKVFDMTVAVTGLNEKTAKRQELNYDKSYVYPRNHTDYYPGAAHMMIKALFEKSTGKILGAQVVGRDGAEKRADVLAAAIAMGATAADLARFDLCYAPPYSTPQDPVNTIGMVITDVLSGLLKEYHWHDVAGLSRDGSIQLVDVRTPAEYDAGHVEGYINIPLSTLRNNLGALSRDKKVYIMCHSGARGYVATRLLMQNGFDAYNLSGGFELLSAVIGLKQQAPQAMPATAAPRAEAAPAAQAAKTAENRALDLTGMVSPYTFIKITAAMKDMAPGSVLHITLNDPAAERDITAWANSCGAQLQDTSVSNGVFKAGVIKSAPQDAGKRKIVVGTDDLARVAEAFVMANAATAMGERVSMHFTSLGLAAVVVPGEEERAAFRLVRRGFKSLKLKGRGASNLSGRETRLYMDALKNVGAGDIRSLIKTTLANGVELYANTGSMELLEVLTPELIEGVKVAGTAEMLESDIATKTMFF